MFDIQIRTFVKDLFLLLRTHLKNELEETPVSIVVVLPANEEPALLKVRLRPRRTIDHLRDDLKGLLQERTPHTLQDVQDIIAAIRAEGKTIL